ncbi:TRAP transporter substrate-binding protein [Cellulomonas aerilata]|uniref:C4-dicarboxylate ABC transporter substrate-binding protein n=1 Tax=Cellulomonas aerilata TaxID=515326 RepID=A0A512DF93_9CELL|nr:TRAP transporter substrate-binding protein [Cellulomonas aerilata]GEO35102.1 C4-dicarboxylate ABC transporter substrate-binding protein [Cellulomonas aerilata]
MKRSKVFTTMAATAVAAMSLAACGGGGGGGGAAEEPAAAGGGEGAEGAVDVSDAETLFKLAFNQTEQHPQYIAAEQLGQDLYEATDGRYAIEVYANEELGTQADVVQNLSDGTVEMMYIGGPVMESFNEDFIVFNLPYMFDSQEAQAEVFADQDVVGDLYTSVEESKNITVLAGLHAGVRNVYNSKRAITEPADLEGLKIRVQQSDSQVAMIEAMGAVASPMGQGEVYSALQTGALDGAENNETVFDALKHSEVAKFYSYTRHLMIPDYLLINTGVLEDMPEEDREAFLELIPGAVEEANEGFVTFAEESRARSEEIGAEFNDDVDVEAFEESVADLVESSINNDVRQELFDAVQAANEANAG